MTFNKTEILLYLIYFHFLVALNFYMLFFSNIEIYFFIDLLFFNVVSICLFISSIFILKHLIIKYNLNPTIKYGHLISSKPLFILNEQNIIYVKYILSHYVSWFKRGRNESTYRPFKHNELFSDEIIYISNNQTIDLTKQFKSFENYSCESTTSYYSCKELLDKYDELHLTNLISKSEIEQTMKDKHLSEDTKIEISLCYINSGIHEQKDVIIGLNNDYTLSANYSKVYSNYKFEYFKLFSILFYILLISFIICIQGKFTYSVGFLFLKAIQYNIFPFLALYFLFKNELFK